MGNDPPRYQHPVRFDARESSEQIWRREILEREMENVLRKDIEGRIAHFAATAAEEAAELMALRKQRGGPGELRDTRIDWRNRAGDQSYPCYAEHRALCRLVRCSCESLDRNMFLYPAEFQRPRWSSW